MVCGTLVSTVTEMSAPGPADRPSVAAVPDRWLVTDEGPIAQALSQSLALRS